MTTSLTAMPKQPMRDQGTASLGLGLLALELAVVASLVLWWVEEGTSESYRNPGLQDFFPSLCLFLASIITASAAISRGRLSHQSYVAIMEAGCIPVHDKNRFPVCSGKATAGVILGMTSLFAMLLVMAFYMVAKTLMA